MDGVPYTLCQSIHGLPSYYVHPGIVPGWMGYILYTLCHSIHGLPSYYVHPGIVPGWMGYRTPCVRVFMDYLVTTSILGLSQDGWGSVHPVSEYPWIT